MLLLIISPTLPDLQHFHSFHHLVHFSLTVALVFLYPVIIFALKIPLL